MELKELTDRTIDLFGVTSQEELGDALLAACGNPDKLRSFRDLVNGDMGTDWMQKIYQYYLADRKEKKQDYTPASLAQFTFTIGQIWRIVKPFRSSTPEEVQPNHRTTGACPDRRRP